MPSRFGRRAFTLVELLVVIAIIGILVALLLPAVQAAREASRRSACSNNLKQLGIGLHNFHDTYKKFPVGEHDDDNRSFSWRTWILPFIEQAPLYDQMVAQGMWQPPQMGGGSNLVNVDSVGTSEIPGTTLLGDLCKTKLAVYACPSDVLAVTDNDGFAKATYCGNVGTVVSGMNLTGCADANTQGGNQNGVLLFANNNDKTWTTGMNSITDGSSNTILVGEVSETENITSNNNSDSRFPIWAGGNNNGGCSGLQNSGAVFRLVDVAFFINRRVGAESNMSFGSKHPGGAQFLLGDASSRFVSQTVDTAIYRAYGSRNGGEAVSME